MAHSELPLPAAFTRRVFLYSAASTLLAAPAEPGHELQNEAMRLELHAGPEGVYLASLALNREPGWPDQGFSGNLLPGKADTTLLRSGTATYLPLRDRWSSGGPAEETAPTTFLGRPRVPTDRTTWESLVRRGRLFHHADLPNQGRRVRVWLTAVPMSAAAERAAAPFNDQLRSIQYV